MRKIADMDIQINTPTQEYDHPQEGVVLVSLLRPEVMARVISFPYLQMKGKTERR
jgi:hypothetical protein